MMPDHEGAPIGVAVDYFKKIANEMGAVEVRFRQIPLKRLLTALEQNAIDMALLFAKNDERAKRFVYPEHPFCMTRPAIAVHASHPLKTVESIESLLPYIIQESAGAYRSPFIRDSRLKFEPLHGSNYTQRCFSMLLLNRAEVCYQPDHYPILFEANRDKYDSRIRVILLPEHPIGLYSVFSKQSARLYLKKYEHALGQVQQEISYETMYQHFMDAKHER